MTGIAQIIALATEGASGILTATQILDNIQKLFSGPKPDLVAAEKMLLALYKELNNAERNQMTLERALADLEKQIEKSDRFAARAARYQLAQTDMGGRVYTLKPDQANNEPAHEICVHCYEDMKFSILQPSAEMRNTLICHNCGAKILKDDGMGSGIMVSTRNTDWDMC